MDGYESTDRSEATSATASATSSPMAHIASTAQRSTIMSKTIDWESQKDFKPPEQEDWRDKVNLGKKYADHRPRVLELLQPFESMWSGHLWTIKATGHRIELLPGSKPFHQPPYRAGPTQRQKEQKEIERMLKKESSGRLTQTGLRPWCWYQRPTGPSVSASTTEDSTP